MSQLPDASRTAGVSSEVNVGGVPCGTGHPLLVIGGPCVLQTLEGALEIAQRLREATIEHGFGFVFKGSFDKANRTSRESYRGPGVAEGLEILAAVRERLGVPVTTDVHLPTQAAEVAEVCDLLQIPAFLARQTDLLLAAAATGRVVNVKKGQFMAPQDMAFVLEKLRTGGAGGAMLTERGTFFGYGRLVNDMTGLPLMRSLGAPVIFDATHSVQQPGGLGGATGGNRAMVPPLARAAVAVGVDGIFLETHPQPDLSPSDGPNMVPLGAIGELFAQLARVRAAVSGGMSGGIRGTMGIVLLSLVAVGIGGCRPSLPSLEEVQRQRESRMEKIAESDPLVSVFEIVSQLHESEYTVATSRVLGLLNAWLQGERAEVPWKRAELLAALDGPLLRYPPLEELERRSFGPADVDYLRSRHLCKRILGWMGEVPAEDPLFAPWIETQQERLGAEGQAELLRAIRIFDWTVRNIRLVPTELDDPGPRGQQFPLGMQYRGPGYRQTVLQTLVRGEGDRLQRARVFIHLCQQAELEACALGIEGADPAAVWGAGVFVGKELFLFEPGLGLPIPGSNQQGIATLAEAQRDPTILRRLSVQGWFDYPWSSSDIDKTIALLDAEPEGLSYRMAQLERGLTGENRLRVAIDLDAAAAKYLTVQGVAKVQLWPLAIQAAVYQDLLAEVVRVNQEIAAWESIQWLMLDDRVADKFPLALARWDHLLGNLGRVDQKPGARAAYGDMRFPESEISRLRTDVQLQQKYNVRRSLGDTQELYDAKILQVQNMMRLAKRTASFWLSLIQYDRGDYENSKNWLEKRVLVDSADSPWSAAARYNLGRAVERLGGAEQAISLYKTQGDPQEHGNRLRARLLERTADETP